MVTKKDLGLLLTWAKKTKEVMDNSGESEFGELRRREKREIFKNLVELRQEFDNANYAVDGDHGEIYQFCIVGDVRVCFSAACEYTDDMVNHLFDMSMSIDNDDSSIEDLVRYLEQQLAGGIKIVNLTPHTITFFANRDGSLVAVKTIPSSGVARAEQTREPMGDIDGIPVARTAYGKVTGLPDSQDGTIYIVSVLTAQAARDRKDLYIVDDLVRDNSGQIMGCKALAQI